MTSKKQLVTHYGSCHCGNVQWEFDGPQVLTAIYCNCSICLVNGNYHFIVPKEQFRLLSKPSLVSTYSYNSKTAVHKFCKNCGIQSYYSPLKYKNEKAGIDIHPQKNVSIQVYCIKPGTVKKINVIKFNGKDMLPSKL
eukprot:450986_1